MDSEKFVKNVRLAIENGTVEGAVKQLLKPADRNPRENLKSKSDWYNALSEEDRTKVKAVIADSVESTIFGFLCVLDGVRKFDEDWLLELRAIHSETGESTLISDSNFGDLHDIYRAMLDD